MSPEQIVAQDTPRLIYLLMWLVLVSGGVWSLHKQRANHARGPSLLQSVLIWAGLFALW